MRRRHESIPHAINDLADAVREVAAAIRGLGPRALGHTTIQAAIAEENMPGPPDHMPDFTLPSSSVRAVLAVAGPKLADFATSHQYAGEGSWSTSDASVLPLEAIPAGIVTDAEGNPVLDEFGQNIPLYRTYANTPLTPTPGEQVAGTVTWSSAGMFDVDIRVVYGDPALGHAAITAGEAPEA